jgi:hypothetical protein
LEKGIIGLIMDFVVGGCNFIHRFASLSSKIMSSVFPLCFSMSVLALYKVGDTPNLLIALHVIIALLKHIGVSFLIKKER